MTLLRNLDYISFGTKYFKICLGNGKIYVPDTISERLWILCDGIRTYKEVIEIASKELPLDMNKIEYLLINLLNMGLIREVEIK